jgi:hypothetical protein
VGALKNVKASRGTCRYGDGGRGLLTGGVADGRGRQIGDREFFYGKLAALLNFKNKFITNDGPNHLRDLINLHNASFRLRLHGQENVPPYYKVYLDERNSQKKKCQPSF